MMTPADQTETLRLSERLGSVRVGLREDLQVTRHLFRGQVSYIIRDPITFQSQRLDPADYDLLARINPERTLSEIFASLVETGKVVADDEDQFFQFVLGLHRIGFLHLPVSDSKILFRRHQQKESAKKRQRWKSVLFLRIPVWNPNDFLDRTRQYAAPIFSTWFFALWVVLVCTAGYVTIQYRHELLEPLGGLLAADNLLVMWFTLIGLKVCHEFGHAYACKHYNGHVPEMGVFLILFTPCAYVDATASWGFTRRRERLIVGLAGMYIESTIAALAVFVWAMTDTGLLHSIAYNIMFLASVVTVLFNINPLMRYDGYYIVSDLTEIPNLRARSQSYIAAMGKRYLLGLQPSGAQPESRRLRLILATYGISAALYRVVLVLTISAVLALKAFLIGLALAAVYLGGAIVGNVLRMTRYLWYAEETTPVRMRATAVGILLLIVLPAGLAMIPVPAHVHTMGVVVGVEETVVRAKTDGFLDETFIEPGTFVESGTLLARLDDDAQKENLAKARANLHSAQIRHDAYLVSEPHRAMQEREFVEAYERAVGEYRRRVAELEIETPTAGRIVSGLRETDVGRFLHAGSPIATIVSGGWRVRTIMTETQLLSARPRLGDEVSFRPRDTTLRTLSGTIFRIAPGGSRVVDAPALTQLGGGKITVDPDTMEAAEPFFEVIVDLPDALESDLRHSMTGVTRFSGRSEPIATRVSRRLIRFLNKLARE